MKKSMSERLHKVTYATKRLHLAPITHKDGAELTNLLNQPLVRKYNDYGPSLSCDEVRAFIQGDIVRAYSGGGMRWTLRLLEKHILVGSIGVYDVCEKNLSARIGFELDTAYHGLGMMSEALDAVMAELIPGVFGKRISRLVALVDPRNEASLRLLFRKGFTETACAEEQGKASNRCLEYVFNS